jgi:hypothetical protein
MGKLKSSLLSQGFVLNRDFVLITWNSIVNIGYTAEMGTWLVVKREY